jgi:hypothetical protein
MPPLADVSAGLYVGFGILYFVLLLRWLAPRGWPRRVAPSCVRWDSQPRSSRSRSWRVAADGPTLGRKRVIQQGGI